MEGSEGDGRLGKDLPKQVATLKHEESLDEEEVSKRLRHDESKRIGDSEDESSCSVSSGHASVTHEVDATMEIIDGMLDNGSLSLVPVKWDWVIYAGQRNKSSKKDGSKNARQLLLFCQDQQGRAVILSMGHKGGKIPGIRIQHLSTIRMALSYCMLTNASGTRLVHERIVWNSVLKQMEQQFAKPGFKEVICPFGSILYQITWHGKRIARQGWNFASGMGATCW